MNQVHENRIKVFVERIVRPILAAENEKLKMREELFAHASDAFEQEKSRGAKDEDAFQQAIERLGDSEKVRRELQEGVSWRSRLDFHIEQFFRKPKGHSQLRHAAKLGGLLGTGVTLCLLAIIAVPYLFGVEKCDGEVCTVQTLAMVWPDMIRAGLRMFPFFFLAAFNMTILAGAFRETIERKSGWLSSCWCLLRQSTVVLLLLCLQSALMTLLALLDGKPRTDVLSLFAIGLFWCSFFTLVAAVALIPWMWLNARKQYRYAGWLELDLRESMTG